MHSLGYLEKKIKGASEIYKKHTLRKRCKKKNPRSSAGVEILGSATKPLIRAA